MIPASMSSIVRHDGSTQTNSAVIDADAIAVTFDGICFADIKLTDKDGSTITVAIYRNLIPHVIERLTAVHAEALALDATR